MTKDELQQQALDIIAGNTHVAVEIGTGGGKTLLALKHLNNFIYPGEKYLVVIPRNSIKKEWINEATKHGFINLLDVIDFVTYRSLNKSSYDYDIVYLDECHSLKYSHSNWLDNFKGKIIGLTGTYPKGTASEKAEMCREYCKKIFEYNVDEAIDDSILNDYQIYIHMLQLSSKNNVHKKNKVGGKWKTSEFKDYNNLTMLIDKNFGQKKQLFQIMRMKAMQSYPTKMEYVKKILKDLPYKVLVFANTQEQAAALCKHSYHSKNKESEKNLELFSKDLIKELSCVDQLSEGKTIPNLKCGIIMHSFNNERLTRQRIGRFLRLNPNDKGYIHILCYENSIDKKWVKNALASFNQNKIKIYRP
jgi:superfamily II DNA or RNA helicase